ncbi:MAG: O-antigen ligase family protein [Bacteroidia bacterium]
MNNTKSEAIIKYLLGTSVFFIPFFPFITPFLWVLLLINFLYTRQFSKSNFKFNPILIVFVLFYFLHILGMLWTTDWHEGIKNLRVQLPLLFFPVLFSFYQPDKKTYLFIQKSLIAGCLIAIVICLVLAAKRYMGDHDISDFFYTRYSVLIAPGYFSFCLNIAVLFVMNDFFREKSDKQFKNANVTVLLIILFMINIIILSSKMSIIAAIISLPFFAFCESIKQNIFSKVFKWFLAFTVIFVIIFYGYIKTYNRFDQTVKALKEIDNSTHTMSEDYYNSSTIRLAEWNYGWEIFKQNFMLGVGTGDIKTATMAKYIEHDFRYGIHHFETTASQYLHEAIILGIIGLIGLVIIYFYPLVISIKDKNYLYASFLIILILYSATGGVFSATSVLIYGLFNSLMLVAPDK